MTVWSLPKNKEPVPRATAAVWFTYRSDGIAGDEQVHYLASNKKKPTINLIIHPPKAPRHSPFSTDHPIHNPNFNLPLRAPQSHPHNPHPSTSTPIQPRSYRKNVSNRRDKCIGSPSRPPAGAHHFQTASCGRNWEGDVDDGWDGDAHW